MTTPKKPGTDLAALKARLAKKSKDGEEAAAPAEAAPAAVEAVEAVAQQHYDPPPAVEQAPAFTPEIPQAPIAAPAAPFTPPAPSFTPPAPSFSPPAAAPAFSAPAASDDPFAGPGGNATFDPGPDLGGDVVPGRSNVGLVAFSGAIFLAVGLGIGWLGHKIISGNERNEKAKAKGDEMYQEVLAAQSARKQLSVAIQGDLGKAVMTDPKAGKDAIVAVLSETFEKKPDLSRMYGWQLASLDATSIKKVFELYEKLNRAAVELAAFAGFLEANAATLGAAGGPVTFGIKFTAEGSQLVALNAALCGDPADLAALTACEDPSKAVAFKVQDRLGGEEKTLLKGTAADQVVFLPPVGDVYNYAIGLEPAKHALRIRDVEIKRIDDALQELASAEEAALKATKGYAENPNVDGPGE